MAEETKTMRSPRPALERLADAATLIALHAESDRAKGRHQLAGQLGELEGLILIRIAEDSGTIPSAEDLAAAMARDVGITPPIVVEEPEPINTLNEFLVAVQGALILIGRPPTVLNRKKALTLAAWLVVMATASETEFKRYVSAIENT